MIFITLCLALPCHALCWPAPPGPVSSAGHGVCDDGRLGSGLCACDATWTTSDCSQQCLGTVAGPGGEPLVCSGQGTCDRNTGACECLAGIAGPDCSIACPTDPLWGVCSAHGTCDEGAAGDGTCACTTGYMGATCGEECPGGKANPCSGHGRCDAPGRACACDQSAASGYWGGDACGACATGWFGDDCTRQCVHGVCPGAPPCAVAGRGPCDTRRWCCGMEGEGEGCWGFRRSRLRSTTGGGCLGGCRGDVGGM